MDYKYSFDYLRSFKDVSAETESLVGNTVKKKFSLSPSELKTVFENGVQGEYGKFIACDPQTLLGWVKKYKESKSTQVSYLASPLINPNEVRHELTPKDWFREANKCFNAYMSGVSHSNFHHCVYDILMVDSRIPLNAYTKYYNDAEIDHNKISAAKQRVLADYFGEQRSRGHQFIYPESWCN